MYGTCTTDPLTSKIASSVGATAVAARLREVLDADAFDDRVRIGSAMTLTEAVHYARHHINAARQLET